MIFPESSEYADTGAVWTGYGSKLLVEVIPVIPRMHLGLYEHYIVNNIEIKTFPPRC